jgi:hypothetical protein
MAAKGIHPQHGLVGKASNKTNPAHQEVLEEFFKGLLQLAQPRATVQVREVVRDVVQTELRNVLQLEFTRGLILWAVVSSEMKASRWTCWQNRV